MYIRRLRVVIEVRYPARPTLLKFLLPSFKKEQKPRKLISTFKIVTLTGTSSMALRQAGPKVRRRHGAIAQIAPAPGRPGAPHWRCAPGAINGQPPWQSFRPALRHKPISHPGRTGHQGSASPPYRELRIRLARISNSPCDNTASSSSWAARVNPGGSAPAGRGKMLWSPYLVRATLRPCMNGRPWQGQVNTRRHAVLLRPTDRHPARLCNPRGGPHTFSLSHRV